MKTSLALAVVATLLGAAPALAQSAPVELWRLDCGTIEVRDLNAFSDDFRYSGETKTLTDSCYLIRHGEQYMVWDTGLPKALQNAPVGDAVLAPTFKLTVVEQLETLGVKPDQISILGISHNHFDHVGQASDFPNATLLIGRNDYAAFSIDPPPFGVQASLIEPWLNGKGKVDLVDGDKDVFGDGSVIMLATPGHTADSHSLLVTLKKTGPVILSGDTVHFEEQFTNDGVPPFNTNRAETIASIERLKNMAANLKATLVVQHDASDIAKLPTFPKSAD